MTAERARLEASAASPPDLAALVLRRVRLRATLRLAWLASLDRTGPGDAETPAERALARLLADADAPAAEAAFVAHAPALATTRDALATVEAALATDAPSRLAHLCAALGLSPLERDAVEMLWARALDPGLGRLYACLNDADASAVVSLPLVARLYGHGRAAATDTLAVSRSWRVLSVEPQDAGRPAALTLDPAIAQWVAGGPPFAADLLARARFAAPRAASGWPVAAVAAEARAALGQSPLVVAVEGPAGIGRAGFAAAVAEALGLRLLVFDAAGLDAVAAAEAARRLARAALLENALPAWRDGAPPTDPGALAFPVSFALIEPGTAVAVARGVRLRRIALPLPGPAERALLWRRHLPASADWDGAAIAQLAALPAVPADIAAAGGTAATVGEAVASLAASQAARLAPGVKRLDCPFTWEELVLPERLLAALADLATEAAGRQRLWEESGLARLFPLGRGLAALFSGPPGTGKTMAAQVVATRIGAPLYRVDLAQVVSKYVGETAERLDRILGSARHAGAILFFDEGDALFGRRGEVRDAHDRYANTETAWLLQAIEDHPGTVLLASNRRGNIDEAFLRRFRFILEFPRPDAAARLSIWRHVTAVACDGDASALDGILVQCADAFDLTGAQIKGAVLTAALAARSEGTALAARHLVRGVDRELLKEGRAFSARDWRRFGFDG